SVTFSQFYSGTSSSTLALGLVGNTSYWFRVRAFNGGSVATNYDTVVTTLTLPAPINSPSGLQASTRTATSITWTWADNSNNETGFRVLSSSDNTNLSGDLAANTTKWVQTGLGVNTSQQVYVQAFDTTGQSNSFSSVFIYTLANAPSGTTLTPMWVSSGVVSWSANGNPTGTLYRTEQSTDNATFNIISIATVTSVTPTGLYPNTTYYFRVRSQNGNGIASNYDVTVSTLTPQTVPAAPSSVAASTRDTVSITWTWVD